MIYLYLDRGTFVHRLHPTVKVLAMFIVFWSVYWVDSPLALAPLALLLLVLAQLTGSWPNFHRLRWLFLLLTVPTMLSWMLNFGRHQPWVTMASFEYGASRAIKIAELLATSAIFLSTTKVEEFTVGLARLGVPYRAGFAITLAFRLVPLFMDSYLTVVDAQTLRGFDFNRGGLIKRVRNYVPVMIPVFMGALRKANNMAMALEARGFGMSHRPTSFIDYPVRFVDLAATALMVALGASYFAIYYTGLGALPAP